MVESLKESEVGSQLMGLDGKINLAKHGRDASYITWRGGGGVLPFFLDMLQVNREHSVVSITLGHMLINGLRHGRTGWKSARDRAHDDMT